MEGSQRVVVEVMLKPEILDPQGAAILAALHRLGFPAVRSVRQGKRFELELAADQLPDGGDVEATVRELADRLLANPVIEDFTVRLDPVPVRPVPGG